MERNVVSMENEKQRVEYHSWDMASSAQLDHGSSLLGLSFYFFSLKSLWRGIFGYIPCCMTFWERWKDLV